jgi:ribonuclease P protein component
MSLRFSSTVRLKARPEFLLVQEQGHRVATKYLTLLGMANGKPTDRLGLIASRKFGNAVARNRAKRRLREIFRRHEPDTIGERGLKGLDLVAIPRRALLEASFAVVDADFCAAVLKLRGQA